MNQQFTIPFRLPGLNEVNASNRANAHKGARLKRDVDAGICAIIRAARIHPISNPCIVHMTFLEPNRRRDADNVESAKKFILDALVKSGILAGDSPRHVVGSPSFTRYVPDEARIIVTLIEEEDPIALRNRLRNASEVITKEES